MGLQVGIKGNNQIAGHMAESRHNGRVLAIVAVKQHRDHMAAFGFSSLGQHAGRIIAAAIVDQQNLILAAQRRAGGIRTANQLRQALLFVINRNNDRDFFTGG